MWKQEQQEDQSKNYEKCWSLTSQGMEGTKHHNIKVCAFLQYFSI